MINMPSIPLVEVPEGVSGDWKVSRFTVSAKASAFDSIRALGHGGRYTPEGTYTRLTRNGSVIMSDTPNERRDHYEPVDRATGNILINGLGLGMVLNACLLKPEVTHATVIELSQDVIDLVGPYYINKFGANRLTIIQASAYDFQPPKGVVYDMVWHDIWDDICTDNLSEMTRLHRKYGRRCKWQGSWGKGMCQYHARRDKREEQRYSRFRSFR